MTIYFLILAPGCYGDYTHVISSHRSLVAARKARRGNARIAIREGSASKGDVIYRDAEHLFPRVG